MGEIAGESRVNVIIVGAKCRIKRDTSWEILLLLNYLLSVSLYGKETYQ